MSLLRARRVSQVFFLLLFVWLCLVLEEGEHWRQFSGWPVNMFLEADPLAMLGVLASSGVVHGGMLLGLLTLLLTMLWGRVFCGFVCPLGAINHFVSWLSLRGRKRDERIRLNRYHSAQNIKYYGLALFVASALAGYYLIFLDPIPLVQRSFTLFLLPLAAGGERLLSQAAPFALVFTLIVLANLWRPRFFCRYICPLGALLGLAGRLAWWRPRLERSACTGCGQCDGICQAAAQPSQGSVAGECVMCLNCLEKCPADALLFSTQTPTGANPDWSRRLTISALALGALGTASGRVLSHPASMLRPPGSLAEREFLARCLRCGQCIAICPGKVLQPAGLLYGLDNYLTPVLNPAYGYCRLDCTACGQVCPSAAITRFSRQMRLGLEGQPPLRLGLAHIDRDLCLPWAYGRPCLVCEENCPVSPKAIVVSHVYRPLPGEFKIIFSRENGLQLEPPPQETEELYIQDAGGWRRVDSVKDGQLNFAADPKRPLPASGQVIRLYLRLARPRVEASQCLGCGVCQYLCPLQHTKAIRVLPENKSDSPLFIQ